MQTTSDIDFAILTDDGDKVDIDETHRLVLHVEYDQDASINDYESDGSYVWVENDRNTGYPKPRPRHFNGDAVKLHIGRGNDAVWYQPYDDKMGYKVDGEWHYAKWGGLPAEVKRKELSRISDLIEYGFKLVGLELQELLTDERGGDHWVEVHTNWLGGCDSVYDGLVEELADELLHDTPFAFDIVQVTVPDRSSPSFEPEVTA